jgi:hypothetical protein
MQALPKIFLETQVNINQKASGSDKERGISLFLLA